MFLLPLTPFILKSRWYAKVSKSRKIVAQCFLITINGLSQVFLKKKNDNDV